MLYILKRVKSAIYSRIRKKAKSAFTAFDPQDKTIRVAMRVTGGVGDAIVICRWMIQFLERFAGRITVDVYFASPNAVRGIFKPNGAREVLPENKFEEFIRHYDFSLTAAQLFSIHWNAAEYSRVLRLAPDLIAFATDIEQAQRPYQTYHQHHPLLDGAFADAVTIKGLTRYKTLNSLSGFTEPPRRIAVATEPVDHLSPILSAPYITIHDGWDANFMMAAARPTKAYFIPEFGEVVALFKERHPDIAVVQVGTKLGTHIPGVDLDLRNKTTIGQVSTIIQNGSAHVDIEGGLVHMASALGRRSVVIFGPTNLEYYGYPENKNLAPSVCGGCMWTTATWMEACAAGHDEAICMRSVRPKQILQAVEAILAENTPGAFA